MYTSSEYLGKILQEKNIRLSHQRLKIFEYIYKNKTHPSVEEIYNDLYYNIPTLSKTTIYNTLKTLVDVDLVKVINIENHEARYDIVTEDHGHFKCESCGLIYDFDINFDSLANDNLRGFKIYQKDVFLKGVCPTCVGKINLINGGDLNGK